MKTLSQRPTLSVLTSSSSPTKDRGKILGLFKRLLAAEQRPSSDFGKVIHSEFQPYRRIIE